MKIGKSSFSAIYNFLHLKNDFSPSAIATEDEELVK